MSLEWLIIFEFSDQNIQAFVISNMGAESPVHLVFLELIMLIIFGETYNSRSSNLCSLFQPPSKFQIFSSAHSYQTLSMYDSPFIMRDQFLHPHKAKIKL